MRGFAVALFAVTSAAVSVVAKQSQHHHQLAAKTFKNSKFVEDRSKMARASVPAASPGPVAKKSLKQATRSQILNRRSERELIKRGVLAPRQTTTPSAATLFFNVYFDAPYLVQPPAPSDLGLTSAFELSFWLSSTSASTDNAAAWTLLTADERATIKAEYKIAGIYLTIAAFGESDTPTTSGAVATTVAAELAAFVTNYDLDGVDIDWEDFTSANDGTSTGWDWIIDLHTALRAALPSPYIITHSPLAPWLAQDNAYTDNAYFGVFEAVGDTIDWLNIQYYNQGTSVYTTCEDLLTASSIVGTSVGELITAGIPAEKIDIGKPVTTADATNGYMAPALFAECIDQAVASWPTLHGVSFWQWNDEVVTEEQQIQSSL